MTIQKILTPFLTPEAGECGFEASAVLAKEFKAHLDVTHLRQQVLVPAGSYYPIAMTYTEASVDALKSAQNQQAEELKALFTALAEKHRVKVIDEDDHDQSRGVTARWSDLDAHHPYDLAKRARVSDLVVVARPAGKTPSYENDLLEDLIFQSARPVLIVNSKRPMKTKPGTVMLAWDGGRESARAMSAATPLLQEAELVIVTTIGDMKWAAEPPEQAAAYLRLHNIHATHLHLRDQPKKDAAELFLEQAE
ncbi:MAG: hypothetical protein ACX939_01635, partial [Hyphococcus sp.]